MTPCPICGKADGACGDQPLAFPPIDFKRGTTMADKNIYVPKQVVKRGKAGYRGANVIVVDAKGDTQPAQKSKHTK